MLGQITGGTYWDTPEVILEKIYEGSWNSENPIYRIVTGISEELFG